MTTEHAPIPQLGGNPSAHDHQRFEQAIAAIDQANAKDPNSTTWHGAVWPKELLHAHLVTEWLVRLEPASTPLALIAGRGHHFKRWNYPRNDYPEGRGGYLRWRRDAQIAHANEIGELLGGVGYSSDEIDHVMALVKKTNRATDAEAQRHEDALCLVFLETQLVELTDDLGEESMVGILAKTMNKMSSTAISQAATLDLSARSQALLDQAAALVEEQSSLD